MECNKEEAVRAKEIAERKMQAKDFLGAKRIALKAQQLYPDLENISQLLTVCEVHCCAATKVNGLEDWYGILQLEVTADEVSIKKQYRKLALLLHPDKNKFVGAESAFKLIGEAHRTLADHSKRSVYDSKRTPFKVPGVQPASSNAFYGAQQQHSPPTFWTFCPFCKIRYQYYRTIMNRPIRCQTCLRTFVAYDLSVNMPADASSGGTSKQPIFSQQNGFSTQSTFKTKTNQFGSTSSSTGFHGNTGGRTENKTTEEKQVPNDPRKKTDVRFEEVKLEKKDEKGQAAKASTNQKQKRSREHGARGSKNKCSGIDSSDSEIEIVTEQSNGFARNNKNQRKSNRAKPNVKYADDQSDGNGLGSPPKKSRYGKSPHELKKEHDASDVGGNKVHKEENGADIAREKPPRNVTEPEKSRSQVGSEGDSSHAEMDSIHLAYVESEFHDFCLDRNATSIKEGQIWALYDDQDGMPRFYAKIIKVYAPRFVARYTWLEFLPEGQTAKNWYQANFPVACGNFRFGKTETTTEIGVFSHLMSWEKGAKKNTFFVKPRKGEVWALYRSWDIDWLSSPKKHRSYEYEVVEVLSDDAEGGGISVVALLMVKGFVSVFTRTVNGSLTWIPPGELIRFSHLIPSCRLTTSEIQGIPEGSYELDTGSLPSDFEQKFASVTLDVKKVKLEDAAVRVEKCEKAAYEANHETSESEPPISASELNNENKAFHDFESDKTWNKFKCGQIWALYSDFDTFPKYYASITSTDESSSEVHVTWLDGCPESDDERKWCENDLPLSTGKFKLSSGKEGKEVFNTLQAFSHPVDIQETGRKNHYCIYPRTGQIWALYRNWSINWVADDLQSCEYDIAEILSTNVSMVKVMFLTNVEGYDTVYKPERKGDMPVISEIPRTEMLRFSHRIPSYRLKAENKGRLYGYWELDSESLPGPE